MFKSEKWSMAHVVSVFDMFCDYNGEKDKAPPLPSNQIEGPRRSKHRNDKPKSYMDCDVEKLEFGTFRTRPNKWGAYVIEDENSSK